MSFADLASKKSFFLDVLYCDLDMRKGLIEKHKQDLKYSCKLMNDYVKDVAHVLLNRMPTSMIANMTYNLVHHLVYCYVGMTVYDYLKTAYLIDEDYNTNYELWKDFSQAAKKIENMIPRLIDENVYNLEEPSNCEALIPSGKSGKKAPISLLNLQHTLSKLNGDGLFNALLDYMRGMEKRLQIIKTGINNLTDDDFKTIYQANYDLYVKTYWPIEGKSFRSHIEKCHFRGRESEIDTLYWLLREEQSKFENTRTGIIWRDKFDDKKALYFEMRRIGTDEEEWKRFFNNICRFEEYERWIEEKNNPTSRGFKAYVMKPEKADVVVARIIELVNAQSRPKAIMMPIRAAIDAGALSRPNWESFVVEFGEGKLSSKTSFTDYTNPDKTPYISNDYQCLVNEFKRLIDE